LGLVYLHTIYFVHPSGIYLSFVSYHGYFKPDKILDCSNQAVSTLNYLDNVNHPALTIKMIHLFFKLDTCIHVVSEELTSPAGPDSTQVST
jgi:hypothetical protein